MTQSYELGLYRFIFLDSNVFTRQKEHTCISEAKLFCLYPNRSCCMKTIDKCIAYHYLDLINHVYFIDNTNHLQNEPKGKGMVCAYLIDGDTRIDFLLSMDNELIRIATLTDASYFFQIKSWKLKRMFQGYLFLQVKRCFGKKEYNHILFE